MHKESIFFKLYNKDAMLFVQNIKEQLTVHGGTIAKAENIVSVSSVSWKKQDDYQQWCKLQNGAA